MHERQGTRGGGYGGHAARLGTGWMAAAAEAGVGGGHGDPPARRSSPELLPGSPLPPLCPLCRCLHVLPPLLPRPRPPPPPSGPQAVGRDGGCGALSGGQRGGGGGDTPRALASPARATLPCATSPSLAFPRAHARCHTPPCANLLHPFTSARRRPRRSLPIQRHHTASLPIDLPIPPPPRARLPARP